MGRETDTREAGREVVYCVVPRELAPKLHEPLVRHFADDPSVEVVVERREDERRRLPERRETTRGKAAAKRPAKDRRKVRGSAGRRMGERRATLVPAAMTLELPRKAQRHAERLLFMERVEPGDQHEEDLDTARLVARVQAGNEELFGTIYTRYFQRVYSYLHTLLNNPHDAEDLTQDVFVKLIQALPSYEQRRQPFRAWMFVVARNTAIDHLRKHYPVEVADPEEIDRLREEAQEAGDGEDRPTVLGWITNPELTMFVERLPLPQRQVLVLSFLLDLPNHEIAAALDRTESDVRVLQSRALRFLKKRLTAIGRGPEGGGDRSPLRRRPRQAPVLRLRRFTLGGG